MSDINKHGVFTSPETTLAVTTGRLTVVIKLVEHDGQWFAGYNIDSRTFGCSVPVCHDPNLAYTGRLIAVQATVKDIIRRTLQPQSRSNSSVVSENEKAECRRMVAMLNERLAALNQTSLF